MGEFLIAVIGTVLTAAAAVIALVQLARTPRLRNSSVALATVEPSVPSIDAEAFGSRIPHNLPPRSGIVGRADEMSRVFDAMGSGLRIISLEGLGGMGKTTIALHCAWRLAGPTAAEPQDLAGGPFAAIVWVDERSGRFRLNHVLDTIADVIDYPFIRALGPDEKLNAILTRLDVERYLLVIDGLDGVDDIEVVRFVERVGATATVVLTTSRRDQLPHAWKILVGSLPTDDATAFLRTEAQRVAVAMPAELVAGALAGVVMAAGGNPLAIKLAVGRLKGGSSLADVTSDLTRATHADLFENIFERNWHELVRDEHARRTLLAIAMHSAECTRPAVEAVVDVPAPLLDEALARLQSTCLIDAVAGADSSHTYFNVHRLTRTFVRDKATREPALRDDIEHRLVEYYLAYCVGYANTYRDIDNVRRLESERANIVHFAAVAFDRARATGKPADWQRVVRYADGLSQLLWGRGDRLVQLVLTQHAAEAAAAVDDGVSMARQWTTIGRIHLWMDNPVRARSDLDTAKAALPPSATDADRVPVTRLEAQIASKAGEYTWAEALLNRILRTAPTSADDDGKSATLVELGDSARLRGDFETARRCFQEALRLDEQSATVEGMAVSIAHLAEVLFELNEGDRSAGLYSHALRLAEESGRRSIVGRCSLGLAKILLGRSQYSLAQAHAQRAEQTFIRLGMVELTEQASIVGATAADRFRRSSRAAYQAVVDCRAVIFDCDDTIIATAKVRWTIMVRTAASFGVELDEAAIRRAWGLPFHQLIETLIPAVPFDEFVETYRREMLDRQPEPTPGALRLLGHLARRRVKMVIVTSGSRDLILQDLQALNLEDTFDEIYGYEQCDFYKPDPRVLTLPIDGLLTGSDIKRGQILYVGDSVRDYRVVKGHHEVKFIAVLSGLQTREDFTNDGLKDEWIVDDLTELLDV